jgi:hypothetical protein
MTRRRLFRAVGAAFAALALPMWWFPAKATPIPYGPHVRWIATIAFLVLLSSGAWAQQIVPLYVARGGMDNPMCSTAMPCQTLNGAVAVARTAGCAAINVGPGTWYETLDLVNFTNCPTYNNEASPLIINGSGSGQSYWTGCPTCTGTLIATGKTDVAVQNLYMYATGGSVPKNILYAQQGGKINVYAGMVFGQSTNQHFHCENVGSAIQLWSDFSVVSGTLTGNLMGASTQCNISAGPLTITFGSNLIFGGPLFYAQYGAGLNLSIAAAGGPVNGKRYQADNLSYIATNGAGCANLPGSSAGTTSTGGWCF